MPLPPYQGQHIRRDTAQNSCIFNGMSDGMSQIKECPVSLFGRILLYHHLFNGTGTDHHLFQSGRLSLADLIHVLDQPLIK